MASSTLAASESPFWIGPDWSAWPRARQVPVDQED
jgi:hypothetical protein